MSARRITAADEAVRGRYLRARPAPFGDLHQRMRHLIECARRCGLHRHDNATWQALWDLAAEVSYHEPARPPYGRRPCPLGRKRIDFV
jgi:hypothetical protein